MPAGRAGEDVSVINVVLDFTHIPSHVRTSNKSHSNFALLRVPDGVFVSRSATRSTPGFMGLVGGKGGKYGIKI